MLKYIFLTLLLSCSSLQKKIDTNFISKIESDFFQTCKMKKATCNQFPISIQDLSIKRPLDGAVCFHKKEIVIDYRQWRDYTSIKKEILLLHELGHCALDLPHGDGIMNPELVDESYFLENKKKLIDNLFKIPN